MCRRSIYLISFVFVLCLIGEVPAAHLAIENHSFEWPELPENDGVYGDEKQGEEIPGWSEGRQLHRQGLYYPWALGPIYPPAPDGYQYAFLRSYATVMEDGIWQVLSETYEAGPYTLTFYAASVDNRTGNDRLDFFLFAGQKANIVSTDSVTFTAVGGFIEYTLEVTLEPDNPAIGQAIGIWFQNTTSDQQSHICIDNVRLETPREAASVPSPADGDLLGGTSVILSWQSGDYAASHKVYIDDNSDDIEKGNADFVVETQANTLLIGVPDGPYPDGLVQGTTYYWRVDEVNDANPSSPWKGDVWSFTTLPKTAWNPWPLDTYEFADPNVDLSWSAGLNAVAHTVYFGTDVNTVTNAEGGIPISKTTYDPGLLAKDTSYYWRVDEFDGTDTHKGKVWSFKTIADISITDPNLVGFYKFDEGAGTKAVDFSGHENHGTLEGNPQWVDGYGGSALDFDGEADYVEIPRIVQDDFTLMAWIKTDTPGMQLARNDAYVGSGLIYSGVGTGGTTNDFALAVLGTKLSFSVGSPRTSVNSGTDVVTGEWIHVAGVRNLAEGTIKAYIDGVLKKNATHENPYPLDANPVIVIGGNTSQSRYYVGLIDDVRIFDKALTQDEINQAMRLDPLLAWNPSPGNGSTPYIRDAMPLSWSPGDKASGHDVYFGIDRNVVADANASDTTGIYRGRQSATIYNPPEGVEWGGGPYYWRIDQYNTDGTISKGAVWTFTVADFLGIEDFEDYNDYEPDRIFDTWTDGWGIATNGSVVGYAEPNFALGEHHVEITIVHGGFQSMPYFFDNNFKYSEASLPLVSARNWTEEGVAVLSLWFYGDSSNAAEQMYVSISNANGATGTVYHDDPAATQINTWTQWSIDLQKFADQGVNLTNVDKFYIGFGDKANLQAGGTGVMYFDDICLLRPSP